VELISSLIFLIVLILSVLFLSVKTCMKRHLLSGLFGKWGDILKTHEQHHQQETENNPVYDGMATVEIPVPDDQVIAYEPLPDSFAGSNDEFAKIVPISPIPRA